MPRHWKGNFLQKMRAPHPAAVSPHSSSRRLVGQLITLDLQPYPPASYLLVLIPDSPNTREALGQTVKQAGGQLWFSVLPQHRPPGPLPGASRILVLPHPSASHPVLHPVLHSRVCYAHRMLQSHDPRSLCQGRDLDLYFRCASQALEECLGHDRCIDKHLLGEGMTHQEPKHQSETLK